MDSDSLLEKLKSMGVKLGASHLAPPSRPRDSLYTIEKVVKGSDFSTMFGQTFISIDTFPLDYQHGNSLV